MIDAEFVKEIERLAKDAQKVETIEIEGVEYTNRHLEIAKSKEPGVKALELATLTGLIDYLNANTDRLPFGLCMVHVANHARVDVISNLAEYWNCRDYFLTAIHQGAMRGFFSSYLDCESFIVALQSLFLPNEDRELILRVVGNIREESVRSTADDGVTQTVTARAGIVKIEDVEVPNPVILKPYRTFHEVEQPESEFILRLKSGREGALPQCALFEADGGKWKLVAIQRIRAYLAERLKEITIIA
jgi:hypothetical protein